MYLNGVMEGNEYREFGALNNLTKAEAAKILEKSLFTLDEGLENVRVVYEGAANYIDFSQQYTAYNNRGKRRKRLRRVLLCGSENGILLYK